MATIEKYAAADGGIRYAVRYRTPQNRTTRKRGFVRKRDAEGFAATVEVSKLRGEYVAPSDARVRIDQLGPAWLDRQAHLKPSSTRVVEIGWRIHVQPRWGSVRIGDIRPSDVQAWIAEQKVSGLGPVSIRRNIGVLLGILGDAVADRLITANPAAGMKLPRRQRKQRTYLDHGQVWQLAEATGEHAALVLLLAYTGLRWGEATGLRVRHLDLLRRRVNVTENAVRVGVKVIVGTAKDHENRTVPFPSVIAEYLARQCEGRARDDLVFIGENGDHLAAPDSRTGWFRRAARTVGAPSLTPHDLRHTAASLAVSAGANVKAVQAMLGHASAAMTLDTYADLFPDDLDDVADRLDTAARAIGVQMVSKRALK